MKRYRKNTKLDMLIQESPCNVVFGVREGDRLFEPDCGAYYSHKLNKIIIHDSWNKNYEVYSVLAHEITHALCAKKKCFCAKSRYICEYHAFKGQIAQCLQYPKALKYTLLWILDIANGGIEVPTKSHMLACKNIIKTKLFKSAKKLSKKTKVIYGNKTC